MNVNPEQKRIILSGCNGKMGRVISDVVCERGDCVIVAGLDLRIELKQEYPVVSNPDDLPAGSSGSDLADVIIDFSHPSFTGRLLDFAVRRRIPAVIATTGIGEEMKARITEASRSIPVFYTANMSMGVNLLVELAKKAASVLSNSFDIEIIEKHHNQKIDAPSGTALMIADAVSSVLPQPPEYVYDRHELHRKRQKEEIGIHSVRGGTIVGEHEVIFAGNDEVVTLTHTAMSKRIFAIGAVNAAMFLCRQAPGLYDMGNLLGV